MKSRSEHCIGETDVLFADNTNLCVPLAVRSKSSENSLNIDEADSYPPKKKRRKNVSFADEITDIDSGMYLRTFL